MDSARSMAAEGAAALVSDSSSSVAGSLSATMPAPDWRWASHWRRSFTCPAGRKTMARRARASSMSPANDTPPNPPLYGPRRVTSSLSISSIALTCTICPLLLIQKVLKKPGEGERTLGTPVTVPAGMTARKASQHVVLCRSSPLTCHVIKLRTCKGEKSSRGKKKKSKRKIYGGTYVHDVRIPVHLHQILHLDRPEFSHLSNKFRGILLPLPQTQKNNCVDRPFRRHFSQGQLSLYAPRVPFRRSAFSAPARRPLPPSFLFELSPQARDCTISPAGNSGIILYPHIKKQFKVNKPPTTYVLHANEHLRARCDENASSGLDH